MNAAELDELLRHAAAGGEVVVYVLDGSTPCFELATLLDGKICPRELEECEDDS